MAINAPLFLAYSDSRKFHEVFLNSNYQQYSDLFLSDHLTKYCYMLDACDSFSKNKGTNYMRYRADQKACYKEVIISKDSDNIKLFSHWSHLNIKKCIKSRALNLVYGFTKQIVYENLETYTLKSKCFHYAYCNAKNDIGENIYRGLFGQETSCSVLTSVSHVSKEGENVEVMRKSWGIAAPFANSGTYYTMELNSRLWSIPCTQRTDKRGILDKNPYDIECYSFNSDQLCNLGVENSKNGFSIWQVYSTHSTISDCIYQPSCYFNSWVQNSKFYMHAMAKGSSIVKPELTMRSNPLWWMYTTEVGEWRWLTESCKLTYFSDSIDYLNPRQARNLAAVSFD